MRSGPPSLFLGAGVRLGWVRRFLRHVWLEGDVQRRGAVRVYVPGVRRDVLLVGPGVLGNVLLHAGLRWQGVRLGRLRRRVRDVFGCEACVRVGGLRLQAVVQQQGVRF
jgi:hypothetical protein